MRPEIERIHKALRRLEEIEQQYKLDKEAAKADIADATRALADISPQSKRVKAVLWANANTGAPKNDLAWVVFGKENQQYHLRKLAAGPHRKCDRCGQNAQVGHQFEASDFYCDPCAANLRAERERGFNEQQLKRQAKQAVRVARIAELKAQSNLTDTDAEELAALMVAEVDGPVSQIADFIFRGTNKTNGHN